MAVFGLDQSYSGQAFVVVEAEQLEPALFRTLQELRKAVVDEGILASGEARRRQLCCAATSTHAVDLGTS